MAVATIELDDGRIVKVEVPDGATQEQIGAFVQQNLPQVTPRALPSSQPTPVGRGQAVAAGLQRGIEEVTGGFSQRFFEAMLSIDENRLERLAEGINSGSIQPTEENIARFDELSYFVQLGRRTLQSAGQLEVQRREKFAPIQEQRPGLTTVGRIAGQIVGGTAIAPGVGSAAPATLTGRSAFGATTGAAFGAAQPTIDDESVAQNAAIGAAFGGLIPPALEKAAFPVIQGATRPVVNFFRGAFGKKAPVPTQIADDFQAFDGVSQAVEEAPGLAPEQVARRAAFEEVGVTPAARSRISGDTDDFARELQLLRQRNSASADNLRDAFFQESEQLQGQVKALSDSLGIPEAAGRSVKDSLDSIQTSLNASKRAAYDDLADAISQADPDLIDSIPIGSGQIIDAVEDAQRRFLDDSAARKLDELLAEYGLIGNPIAKRGRVTQVDFDGQTINVRGDIRSLNLGSLEEFRQRVNQALDVTDSRQSAARSAIIGELDAQADELVRGVEGSGVGRDIVKQAQRARGLARQEKLVFNQKDLVEQLTGNRPGTVTPLVEASKAMQKIKNAPPEQVNKLIKVLQNTDQGQQAIDNMGSSIVIDLLNAATKSARQIRGPGGAQVVDFSGSNFTKAINSYGNTPKQARALLKKVLGNQAFSQMLKLEKIGQLRITPDAAVQKGSAPDLINAFLRSSKLFRRIPLVGRRVEGLAEDLATGREARAAADITPENLPDETKDFILINAPKVAAIMGLTREADNGLPTN